MKCVSCGREFTWGEGRSIAIHETAPERDRCNICIRKIYRYLQKETEG